MRNKLFRTTLIFGSFVLSGALYAQTSTSGGTAATSGGTVGTSGGTTMQDTNRGANTNPNTSWPVNPADRYNPGNAPGSNTGVAAGPNPVVSPTVSPTSERQPDSISKLNTSDLNKIKKNPASRPDFLFPLCGVYQYL